MRPLIDGDILLHEIGWSSEFKDKETGEEILLPFSTVADMLDTKIEDICSQVNATEEPTIFFTASPDIVRIANQYEMNKVHTYTKNFRYEIAKSKPYKGTRKQEKPFHFLNIAAYLISEYKYRISTNGLEADDELGIEQVNSKDTTIICSRDKDLRMIPGWHYSWECGKQREIGPHFTDRLGSLKKEGSKITGYGLMFFYYQMLVGDSADNIPGLPGWGPVKAYKLLSPLKNDGDMWRAICKAYRKEGFSEDYFNEQHQLLWIKQSYD